MYFEGGQGGDPYLNGNGTSNTNYGYRYNVRNLNHWLEMQLPKREKDFTYINKGAYIQSEDKNGNEVRGYIITIKKDEDGYISSVHILNDKNGKIIPVDIDLIRMVSKMADMIINASNQLSNQHHQKN